jgi:hypothetical protein
MFLIIAGCAIAVLTGMLCVFEPRERRSTLAVSLLAIVAMMDLHRRSLHESITALHFLLFALPIVPSFFLGIFLGWLISKRRIEIKAWTKRVL